MIEEWLTITQAAELSEYHPNYIRQILRQKKIEGRKWGASWQVRRASLLAYRDTKLGEGKKRGKKRD